jgi:hypothetical protein
MVWRVCARVDNISGVSTTVRIIPTGIGLAAALTATLPEGGPLFPPDSVARNLDDSGAPVFNSETELLTGDSQISNWAGVTYQPLVFITLGIYELYTKINLISSNPDVFELRKIVYGSQFFYTSEIPVTKKFTSIEPKLFFNRACSGFAAPEHSVIVHYYDTTLVTSQSYKTELKYKNAQLCTNNETGFTKIKSFRRFVLP